MVKDEEIIPTREFALNLLRTTKISYSVYNHSLKVANKALEIANRITKAPVDKNLVEVGALLHDIGRSKTHGFEHAFIGGQILRERGLSPKIARICETHILGGLDKEDSKEMGLPEKDFLPNTIEEKIVCLADKLIGKREVTVEERFEKWFKKYGKSKILLKSKQRVEEMKKELEGYM